MDSIYVEHLVTFIGLKAVCTHIFNTKVIDLLTTELENILI